MIHGELSDWRCHVQGAPWERVRAFLAEEAAAAPCNEKIPLGEGGMFALVMAYDTRPPEEGVLEAHDAHVDVQMSLDGSEFIDWFPRGALREKAPYDAEKDVVFFERPEGLRVRLHNVPGRFTVLFPNDAHMAQLCGREGPAPVRKVVVKVPVALLPAWELHA